MIKLFINDIYHLKVLNLVSLSTQSLASCVNYFCLELFTVFFQHENRFRYKFFRYCSIFKVLCASALAADDLIILPQKRFFVKRFFEKLLNFSELGALRTSQCQLVFFSVYWFFSRASRCGSGSHSFASALGAQV